MVIVKMTSYGVLTREQMTELLQPGAIDGERVAGNRVRWAYRTTRSDVEPTKAVVNALKQKLLEAGAAEVLAHSAPFLDD